MAGCLNLEGEVIRFSRGQGIEKRAREFDWKATVVIQNGTMHKGEYKAVLIQ
jgi:hypothetical protein